MYGAQGLKGVGGKIIILEEASRLDKDVFTEVIVPLLGVKNTTLLAISTPLGDENYYSAMLKMKRPNGVPLFNTVEVRLMCQKCKEEGKTECPHSDGLPPWKTGDRQKLVQQLMENDKAMFMREQLGIVTSANSCAFHVPSIHTLGCETNYVEDNEIKTPDTVYIVIDPCGGGASGMAIISGVVNNSGKLFLIGADTAIMESDEDQELFITNHILKLQEFSFLRTSKYIIIIERNYGGSILASRIFNICLTVKPKVHSMMALSQEKIGNRKVGVCTSHQVKERARIDLQRLLQTNNVRFIKGFKSKTSSTRDDICDQLRQYKYEIKPPRDEFGSYRTKLTGKGGGKNDDLALSLNLLAFWPLTILKHDSSSTSLIPGY